MSKNEKDIRDIAREYYERSSALEHRFQNMSFEAHNLQHQISRCKEFISRHEQIDLCSVEEFRANAPWDILRKVDVAEEGDSEMRDVNEEAQERSEEQADHVLTVQRLRFELEERKRLLKETESTETEKRRVVADNNQRSRFLKGLHGNVRSIRDASKPLQQYMKMDYYSNHTLNELARQLPTPLYVLFNSIAFYRDSFGAYHTGLSLYIFFSGFPYFMIELTLRRCHHVSCASDTTLSVQIDGDFNRAKAYWEKLDSEEQEDQEQQQQSTLAEPKEGKDAELDDMQPPSKKARQERADESSDAEAIFMEEDDDKEDNSLVQTPTGRQTSVVQPTPQQINRLLEVFPLSLKITIVVPFSDKSKDITLIFSYLPHANLIVVNESNYKVLHRLFSDDTGYFSPNMQILPRYNFSEFAHGKPYKWAQWIAGLDFLEPISQKDSQKVTPSKKYSISTIIELVKYKIRASRLLHHQIRNLEDRGSLPEFVVKNTRPGFSPEESVKLESFRRVQQSASAQRRTVVAVISRGDVQLEAKIDIPWIDYPVATPQFKLKFVKGQPKMNWNIPENLQSLVTDSAAMDVRKRSAAYDTTLRDIENEVNSNTPLHLRISRDRIAWFSQSKTPVEDESPFYLLSFQLARLMVCIDIFFSSDQSKIAEFLDRSRQSAEQEQIARKHVGRSLLSPLRFSTK